MVFGELLKVGEQGRCFVILAQAQILDSDAKVVRYAVLAGDSSHVGAYGHVFERHKLLDVVPRFLNDFVVHDLGVLLARLVGLLLLLALV